MWAAMLLTRLSEVRPVAPMTAAMRATNTNPAVSFARTERRLNQFIDYEFRREFDRGRPERESSGLLQPWNSNCLFEIDNAGTSGNCHACLRDARKPVAYSPRYRLAITAGSCSRATYWRARSTITTRRAASSST